MRLCHGGWYCLCLTTSNVFFCTVQQVTGSDAAAVSAAQAADPYGIRIALRSGHPLALLTWQQYIATVTRMSRTVEQQLQGPAREALAAFNRERKLLVRGWKDVGSTTT